MAAAVGMITLRHQIVQRRAGANVGLEQSETVYKTNVVFRRELANLLRMLVERVVWIVEVCGQIRRGREQNHSNTARQ